MDFRHRTLGAGVLVVLLSAFVVSQLQAQSPTATPSSPAETPTVTPTSVSASATQTPTISPKPLSARQAVVKAPIGGDSVEVVFTDNGQIATVHLSNVDAPESVKETECFGRESAEYATQAYQGNPLISIELVSEITEGEGSGYIHLADGTLLNMVMVLFGYARYDDAIESMYSDQIRKAETQSKQGKTGLWRSCGETEKPPRPCFLFNYDEMDSDSKREVLAQLENASDISGGFRYAYYDPVQNEVIVSWRLWVDDRSTSWFVDEYYRLPDCLRDRSVMVER